MPLSGPGGGAAVYGQLGSAFLAPWPGPYSPTFPAFRQGVTTGATITSNGTGGGNASAGSSWLKGVAPRNGDLVVIQAGDTITVDQNMTWGSNQAKLGHAFTLNGTSSSVFATLQVNSGVTLTLKGYDTTNNTLGLINRFALFSPQPGSTILGHVVADWGSCILNNGLISAVGNSGNHITFSIPASNVPSWATQVTNEAYSLTGNNYTYDPSNKVFARVLIHDWIANAAGTGIGSFGDSSLSFSSVTGDTTALATEVALPAFGTEVSTVVNGTGKYAVDYDSGSLFWYSTRAGGSVTFNATYKYLVNSTLWRGWGIKSANNNTFNSAIFSYCDFSYMGGFLSGGTVPVLWLARGKSAGANSGATDRIMSVTNCSFTRCYKAVMFDATLGASGDSVPCSNNTFNNCRGGSSPSGYCVWFSNTAASQYIDISNNTVNTRNAFVYAAATGSSTFSFAGMTINNNTGTVGVFLNGNAADLWDDGVISGNNIQGPINNSFQVLWNNIYASAGHPLVIKNNHFSYAMGELELLAFTGSNVTIDSNQFRNCYGSGLALSTDQCKISNVKIQNNVFHGTLSGAGYNAYGYWSAAIEPGTNVNQWVDGLVIQNNTFLDNPKGFAWNGSFDGCVFTMTGLEVRNNMIVNTSTSYAGWGLQRHPNSSTNQGYTAVLEMDNNLIYSSGCPYYAFPRSATFIMSGSKYNFNNSRNVTGVSLSQPGYSTAQGSGRTLAYTINTAGSDETLSWGGGTAVQIVFDHGTSSGSNTNSTSFGIAGFFTGTFKDTSKSWSTTLGNSNCPSGCWLKIPSTGYIGMVLANTATTLTVAPSFVATGLPGAVAYSIYYPELTLTDTGQTVQGITVMTPGSGNTTCTFSITGGGGSSATATATLGGLSNGELVGGTITNAGSGYTSVPTVTVTANGTVPTAVATLGSVVAGIDIRSLPATSQSDTGITITMNDVFTNPNLVATSGASDANYKVTWGGGGIDAGTSTNAPALDYFGTTRPQGAAVDIGFYELAYSISTGGITLGALIASGAGAGSTGASATGGILLAALIAAGTGIDTATASGAVTLGSLIVAGAGGTADAASGSITLGSLIVTGAATSVNNATATGAITLGSLLVAGAGGTAEQGSGVILLSPLVVVGFAPPTTGNAVTPLIYGGLVYS